MPQRSGPVHVVTTTRHFNGKVYQSHLLRRSYRDGPHVRNETLGNLSHLPDALIDIIRRALKGETFVPAAQTFEIVASHAHGHVQAVTAAMKRLGLAALIASRPCRERDLVLAMIAARVLDAAPKLATVRWWKTTTLPQTFAVEDADEQDLYGAMDWLLARQDKIQVKLAARHLDKRRALALYDLTSSYFEGTTCPLARRGYSRDGKRGTLQVNYGLLTDERGCPVAVSVHEGNTADPTTLMPQIERLKTDFAIERLVMIGDRGMISHKAVEAIKVRDGIDWITALKTVAIRPLVEGGSLQLDLFDERNLFELTHPDYPGERLVACRNPALAELRRHKRADLLAATSADLDKIKTRVAEGRLAGKARIGLAVGKIIDARKVAKHFVLDIADAAFAFRLDQEKIDKEATLDGLYIIRTSVPAEHMDGADCVRHYKSLSQVERAFRSLKTVDLKIRPIHHRLEDRVRAHIFLCMLAYYVEWHMRDAWRPLLFADEDQAAKLTRDPVAPAAVSQGAAQKASRRTLDDGSPVHSFDTLIADLATVTQNTCRIPTASYDDDTPTFNLATIPSPHQVRALDLINTITP